MIRLPRRRFDEFLDSVCFSVTKLEVRSHAAKELEDYRVFKGELRQLKQGVSAKAGMLAIFTGFGGIFLTCGISLIGSDFSSLSWRLVAYLVAAAVSLILTIISGITWKVSTDNLADLFTEIESRPLATTGDETGEVSSSTLESLPSERKPKD